MWSLSQLQLLTSFKTRLWHLGRNQRATFSSRCQQLLEAWSNPKTMQKKHRKFLWFPWNQSKLLFSQNVWVTCAVRTRVPVFPCFPTRQSDANWRLICLRRELWHSGLQRSKCDGSFRCNPCFQKGFDSSWKKQVQLVLLFEMGILDMSDMDPDISPAHYFGTPISDWSDCITRPEFQRGSCAAMPRPKDL